jgi:two-component system response regulator YesN
MITMLLVEDESFERKSLATCVDWELIGVALVGEAVNGSQGLAKTLELKPDIVLTDVKMPVMNGIEMSRRIRQAAPDVKILFLSSYDDFEYAKQAIDLNISAYLMKPVNEVELLRVVKKVADEISTLRLEQQLLLKKQDNLSVSVGLARQALVSRALGGMHVEEADARNLGLDWLFLPEQNFVITLCVHEPGMLVPVDAKLEQLNQRCQRILPRTACMCMNAGYLIVLCAPPPESGQPVPEAIQSALRAFFQEQGAPSVRIEAASGQDLARLYARLLRQGLHDAPVLPRPDKKKQNKEQIVRAIEQIISEQYHSPLTLESIARSLHFTPNYVGSIFRSVTHLSVNRYLLQVRLDKAKALLTGGQLPLLDVAERCGFGSNTYFHSSFKREVGMTPSEYRHLLTRRGDAPDGQV